MTTLQKRIRAATRIAMLANHGWKFLRISECELVQSPDDKHTLTSDQVADLTPKYFEVLLGESSDTRTIH